MSALHVAAFLGVASVSFRPDAPPPHRVLCTGEGVCACPRVRVFGRALLKPGCLTARRGLIGPEWEHFQHRFQASYQVRARLQAVCPAALP